MGKGDSRIQPMADKGGTDMPVASSLKELKDALNTRETNITRALEDLFGDPNTLNSHIDWPKFKQPWALGKTQGAKLPQWAIDELQTNSPGTIVKKKLTPDEIEHLRNWPYKLKEEVRDFLSNRVTKDPHLKFRWELHSGSEETWDRFSVPGEVIFRSPQKNVSFSGATTKVKSKVKVGP
jgi:hypothetical protein